MNTHTWTNPYSIQFDSPVESKFCITVFGYNGSDPKPVSWLLSKKQFDTYEEAIEHGNYLMQHEVIYFDSGYVPIAFFQVEKFHFPKSTT